MAFRRFGALKPLLAGALLLGTLGATIPLARAAGQEGGWRIYTVANGLAEPQSFRVAPDGRGGVWVGHVSGGRGIGRQGGLAHIDADGDGRALGGDPLAACSSVDALALATQRDGPQLWLKLSGVHDYGSSDYGGRCTPAYGAAIGYIDAEGAVQLLPLEQQPADVTAGLAVDALGRVWAGTTQGAAVRGLDGVWREVALWGENVQTWTLKGSPDGGAIAIGSSDGNVAVVRVGAGNPDSTALLAPPTADRSRPVFDIAWTPDGLGVTIGRTLYRTPLAGVSWQATELPIDDDYFSAHLAYVGGAFYAGVPAYPTGLYRLDGQSWTPIAAGATPLLSGAINDLEAASATTLLIATERGAAQLDTTSPPADPSRARGAFSSLWQRTNRGAGDSWVWGPFAWAERYEPYKEGPGGVRYVRYYDKARMELSQPDADPAAPWYVTNGLLVVEMVNGKVQEGDDPSRAVCPLGRAASGCPAYVPVAGDANINTNNFAPTYGEFAALLPAAPSRVSARVGTTFTQGEDFDPFVLGERAELASPATTIASHDAATGHNIPQVFWDYMNRQPADWLFAFGHPISEPVWVRVKIGGVEQWVLAQLFERRALTYTPANDPAWQVEMGNVGQHYFAWRYGADQEDPPWATPLE
jgi:hypothetical protein